MKYDCKIRVVDAVMGSGKSSAAINYINKTGDEEKILYITPYMSEVARIQEFCRRKNFYQPDSSRSGTKLRDIQRLFAQGRNIVSTHALFSMFDEKTIELCRNYNYTLIMDEVASVVEKHDISDNDVKMLKKNLVEIDESTHLLKWRKDKSDYTGKYDIEKRMCEMNSLVYYNDNNILRMFPVQVFNAFRNVYIMTYMFDAQIQKYYYDYHKVPYTYIYIKGNSYENYEFTEEVCKSHIKYDYRELIEVMEHKKLNQADDNSRFKFSKSWYNKPETADEVNALKKRTYNFFFNVCGVKSEKCLWTVFKAHHSKLKGKGYTKGFLPLNCRATNKYRNRTCVAYLANVFLNPNVKNFFTGLDIKVNEDKYALSEMLQFIWRSAVRDGKHITVYVPSARMRGLLKGWIEEMGNEYDRSVSR